MTKTILVTGSTDGIGLLTAKDLLEKGHHVLLHGRNPEKLRKVEEQLRTETGSENIESYVGDLSDLSAVKGMADAIKKKHSKLDILINNAGVFKMANTKTKDGLDARFVVNTIAPYFLTQQLLPTMEKGGRVINLSSAAQAPVDIQAMKTGASMDDGAAYAQSKLAITMWSRTMGLTDGPMVVSVNPKSFLGSKMVKEAYGVAGGDVSLGSDILVEAALSDTFANASGKYFDNDIERFSNPHPDALNSKICNDVVEAIEEIIARLS